MITIYYDGKCGLCSREINHYKKIAPVGIFDWQDITVDASALTSLGVSFEDGLKLLHAKDGNDRLHIGIDAFLLIWREMPYWRILGKVVAVPFVYSIVNWAYRAFADWRFKRLPHCQITQPAKDKK